MKIICAVLLVFTFVCFNQCQDGPPAGISPFLIANRDDILDIFFNRTGTPLNMASWPGELCDRPCRITTASRACYFNWVFEHYHAMGPACGNCAKGVTADCFNLHCVAADGVPKGVMSINRKVPGPPIHVCQNDLVIVDVANHMAGTSATIHWHGFHMRETPHMDGVPFVTQCPISYSNKFRYAFRASEPGTQFYHSHSGHHKANGHYGGIVVRQDRLYDPASTLYDFDLTSHLMVVSDWMHDVAEALVPGIAGRPILPDNLLINGRGQFEKNGQRTKTPLEIFRVKSGARFRFRFVNSVSHVCPIQVQIERHRMQIIASDSYPLQMRFIDTFMSTGGERYDFIVNADQPIGEYWIRIQAHGPCFPRRIEQVAILKYVTDLSENEIYNPPSKPISSLMNPLPIGITLNHPNTTCFNEDDPNLCIVDMQAHTTDVRTINDAPDHQFIMAFDNHVANNSWIYSKDNYIHTMNTGGNFNLIGAINRISFMFPPFPLLTQPNDIKPGMFCDEFSTPAHCRGLQICPCLHLLKVKLNSVVELVIVDETREIRNLNHPFHLHGHHLYVVGMGQGPKGMPMSRNLARGMISTRSLSTIPSNRMPPIKDTVSIPSRGFTIVRFRASNPGFWLMHCHFEWHMAVGMGLVLQVGEVSNMVKPPDNFPKCGNFLPDVDRRAID